MPDQQAHHTGAAAGTVEANASYAGEWALFTLYCQATGQSALPTTAATVAGFLTAVPCRPATGARRRRAIAAAHRRARLSTEFLREDHPGAGGSATSAETRRRREHAGDLIAVCPTRGWPTGLTGRRDGFLVVLIDVLGLTQRRAARLGPAEVTSSEGEVSIAGTLVPSSGDPRRCPGCAVARWLEVCDLDDGLGQAIARRLLTAAPSAAADGPHVHLPDHQRWRQVRWLVTGVDQHGWIREEPLSPRAISGRLRDLRGRTTGTAAGPPRVL